jgi:hypothetical protein
VDVLAYRVKQHVNDCLEQNRNRRWAEEAWEHVAREHPAGAFSLDYADGFRDGFACYLYRGCADVPPLPPRRYRGIKYQTPAGYRAIEDWFAGYRHGGTVAQQGGYRDWITGPSSLRSTGEAAHPEVVHPEVVAPAPVAPPGVPLPVPAPKAGANDGESTPVPLPDAQRQSKPPSLPPPLPLEEARRPAPPSSPREPSRPEMAGQSGAEDADKQLPDGLYAESPTVKRTSAPENGDGKNREGGTAVLRIRPAASSSEGAGAPRLRVVHPDSD